MCGIYGYFGHPKKPEKVYKLMKKLGKESEIRGIDSAGYFACSSENHYIHKSAVRASQLFVEDKMNLYDAIVNEKAYAFLGHNRDASIGEVNSRNAHPFEGERYVQVHNGTCPQIWGAIRKIDDDETDSSAIARAVNSKGLDKSIRVFNKIECYSLVYFDKQSELMIFLRDPEKPMYICDMRDRLGIRIFASTKEILHRALESVGYRKMPEGFWTLPYWIYYGDPKTGEVDRAGKYAYLETEIRYKRKKERKDIRRRFTYKF